MKRKIILGFILALFFGFMHEKTAWGFGGPWDGIRVDRVYAGSELVCVGEIVSVSVTGKAVFSPVSQRIHIGGTGKVEGETLIAEMNVVRHIKGTSETHIKLHCYSSSLSNLDPPLRGPVLAFLDRQGDEYRPHDDYSYCLPISKKCSEDNSLNQVDSILAATVLDWSKDPASFNGRGYLDREFYLRGYVAALENLMKHEDYVAFLRKIVGSGDTYAKGLGLWYLVRSREFSYYADHVAFVVEHKDENVSGNGICNTFLPKPGDDIIALPAGLAADATTITTLCGVLRDESSPLWLQRDACHALRTLRDPRAEDALRYRLSHSQDFDVQYYCYCALLIIKTGSLKGMPSVDRFKEQKEERINLILK
ncbi:MAG TPA: HEAT repeat domain-containing protein [bacterium]|nr:HEAT repeat domain-containing protein [bacterium]